MQALPGSSIKESTCGRLELESHKMKLQHSYLENSLEQNLVGNLGWQDSDRDWRDSVCMHICICIHQKYLFNLKTTYILWCCAHYLRFINSIELHVIHVCWRGVDKHFIGTDESKRLYGYVIMSQPLAPVVWIKQSELLCCTWPWTIISFIPGYCSIFWGFSWKYVTWYR